MLDVFFLQHGAFLDFKPSALNLVLALYMLSYILLMCALILIFSMFVRSVGSPLSFKSVLSVAVKYRLRWSLVFLFSAMSAIPPFFFFFSKLALLSSVLNFGLGHVAVFFLSYVFFSWMVYYTLVKYLYFTVKVPSAATLSNQRLSSQNSALVVFIVFFLFFLSFFFEDIFFTVCWFFV